MAHHEVELPSVIGYGTAVGPSWANTIVALKSGATESVQGQETPRHRFMIEPNIRKPSSWGELKTFMLNRRGSGYSWNLKDWTDYASTATGTTHHDRDDVAISNLDQALGTGDGVTTQFQIVKKYTSGLQTFTRNIRKIRTGTVTVAEDGGLVSPSAYSVNDTTGIITFNTAPPAGAVLTCGYEFLVPVRATEGVDEWLNAVLAGYDFHEIGGFEVVEEIDPSPVNDDIPPLGSKDHGAITSSVSISQQEGIFHYFTQTSAGLEINLPDIAGHYGGLAFVLANNGTTSLGVRTSVGDGGTLIATIPAGVTVQVLVADSGGSDTWLIA